MLISFLVPVYNVKNYIRRCLDSILEQKGASYEIVLLDDGSNDGSELICDEYASKYPDIIRVIHKKNEGLLLTRRRGFEEANGEWFVCVDSDDYIMPNYLETISDAIRHYDCDMLMFDYESFYPDGHTEESGIELKDVKIYEGKDKEDIYTKRLLKNKYNNMWSKVFKRSLIDFENDYSVHGVKNMCEDAIQSYELYTRADRIVFIPEVLYAYRRNIASITSNLNMDYWYALGVSYELGWKYIDVWQISDETTKAYAARCVSYYCDFLEWLFNKSGITDANQIKNTINDTLLQRDTFTVVSELYRKEYLATKYLQLRNPLIIQLVKKRAYRILRWLYKLEFMVRK